jgi:hypothetical protein
MSGSQAISAGKKGKKGRRPVREGPEPPGDGYISVYNFFQRSKAPVYRRNLKLWLTHLSAHGITVKDPNMPVINVGTRQNPSYLPPDVCVVLPGQPSGMKLTPGQTQQMIRFAVRRPAANARSIVTSGARLLGIEPPINTTLVS